MSLGISSGQADRDDRHSAVFGVVSVAPDLVAVVLGSKWADTAGILQVLAWVGIVQSLQSLNTDALQALGLTSRVFRFTVIFTPA